MSNKLPGVGGFHYVQSRRKIPKLDVSLVASGSLPSSVHLHHQPFAAPVSSTTTTKGSAHKNGATCKYAPKAVEQIVTEQMSEDIWGDEDDELMMLMASQVADTMENGNKTQIQVEQPKYWDRDVLLGQVATLNREKSHLLNELAMLRDRCQTKDGELATLHNDLDKKKKIQRKRSAEKMHECERIRSVYQCKLFDVKRIIPAAIKHNMFRLCLMSGTPATPVLPSDQLFIRSQPPNQKQRHTNGHMNTLRANIVHLQLIAARHALTARLPATNKEQPLPDQLRAVAFDSVSIIRNVCMAELHIRTTNTAPCPSQNYMFYYYDAAALNATRMKLLAADGRLNDDREVIDDEMQSTGRRVLFCLADMCRRSSEFAQQLLLTSRSHGGPPTIVDLLVDTLTMIGLSDSWQLYLGFIEAASMLLHSLASHYSHSNEASVHRLLHSLLFCRPNTRALVHLSAALRALSSIPDGSCCSSFVVQTVCRPSSASVLIDESKRRVQFHYTSCPLQMFAALVRTEFDAFGLLMAGHLDTLLAVTLNTLVMMQTQTQRDPVCLCYAQLVCACVVLLYLCERQWTEDRRAIIDLQVMSSIARLGIIMIYDHFVIRCESVVLQVGGPVVKQRLHATFAWLVKHAKLFGFANAHMQAIRALRHLRRIPHMVELLNVAHHSSAGDHVHGARRRDSLRRSWSLMLAEVDDEWGTVDSDETQMSDDSDSV